jgi:hypothetical protein
MKKRSGESILSDVSARMIVRRQTDAANYSENKKINGRQTGI